MNIKMTGKGKATINGVTYSGRNISIQNGIVNVDGDVKTQTLVGPVNVVVNGNVERLTSETGKVTANDVGSISTGSGDVVCKSVSGSVSTGSGDVKCGKVNGSIKTGSGDISRRVL